MSRRRIGGGGGSRVVRRLLIAGLCVLTGTAAAAGITVTDDRGRSLELRQPAHRVVSLAPNITEMLFAVGAGAQVVGVSEYSDYPPAAQALPTVSNAVSVDYEHILNLEPDLVFAWLSGNGPRNIERLERLGVSVFASEPRRFADVQRLLVAFATLTGHAEAGRTEASRFARRIEAVRAKYAGKPPVTVFFQVSHNPLMTLNDQHLTSELLTLCAGVNVFGEYPQLVPTINLEDIFQHNADVIIISSSMPNVDRVREYWLAMNDLKAARRRHVFVVAADLINRQTPRLALGAEQVCGVIDQARSS